MITCTSRDTQHDSLGGKCACHPARQNVTHVQTGRAPASCLTRISHIFDETVKTKRNTAPKGEAMKTKGGKTRWSANCRAALMLKVGLKKGTIDPNANPKTVYLSKPEYQRYPLANFRAGLNRIKAELGVHVRGGGNGKWYLINLSCCCHVLVHDSQSLLWRCFLL